MSEWSIRSKNKQFPHLAHFWWATWAICSHRSLKKREWVNHSGFFEKNKNVPKNMILVKFCWANCSFSMSERANEQFAQKNERFAHSLICLEWPERFSHNRSFDMSDLSDLLAVTHLSWVIWANRSQSHIWYERSEWMSKWAMRKWVNSQPC